MCRYTGWWCGVESGHGGCPGGLITVHTLQSVRIRVSGAPPGKHGRLACFLAPAPAVGRGLCRRAVIGRVRLLLSAWNAHGRGCQQSTSTGL